MKITLSTAMRARDVSRPREEHLAEAAARDEALTRPDAPPPAPAPDPPHPTEPPPRRRRHRGR